MLVNIIRIRKIHTAEKKETPTGRGLYVLSLTGIYFPFLKGPFKREFTRLKGMGSGKQ